MRRFFGIIFLFSLSFFSCSNAVVQKKSVKASEGEETLKNIILGKEANISWTGELEGDRLLFDVYRDIDHVASDVALYPVVAKVACSEPENAVYPDLVGFGSLDTRNMSADLKVFVNNFCSAFSKNIYIGPEKFFDSKYFFNYVFFRDGFVKDWVNQFGGDFPQKKKKSEDGAENVVPELFTSWLLGAPSSSGEILQLPVRFYFNKGYVDFVIYIRLDNNKIYQISRGVFGR